jgi:C-terminal processing protease CtpA/Prc
LLENALGKKRVDPGRLLQKGIEELDAALANPVIREQYVPGKQAEALAFRDHLKRKFAIQGPMTRAQVEQQIREIALAAQDMLQLSPTVSILELACGASYAIDNYTAYLTPDQFRQLCDALKGETNEGMAIQSVLAEMKSGDIGYLRILSFQDSTLQELDDWLGQLTKAGARGLVLDLRGNPGGLFEVAVETARRFLSSGVITTVENQDPKFSTVYHARNAAPCTLPLVVVVDGDTASAAEVLAGALKENGRARLVGENTFGKGCTQSLVKLPAANGVPTGGLRVTVARFFSPKGQAYTGRGVAPHRVVPRDKPEMMDNVDHQLVAALEDVQRQVPMMR